MGLSNHEEMEAGVLRMKGLRKLCEKSRSIPEGNFLHVKYDIYNDKLYSWTFENGLKLGDFGNCISVTDLKGPIKEGELRDLVERAKSQHLLEICLYEQRCSDDKL